jgi:hypothetical protein
LHCGADDLLRIVLKKRKPPGNNPVAEKNQEHGNGDSRQIGEAYADYYFFLVLGQCVHGG